MYKCYGIAAASVLFLAFGAPAAHAALPVNPCTKFTELRDGIAVLESDLAGCMDGLTCKISPDAGESCAGIISALEGSVGDATAAQLACYDDHHPCEVLQSMEGGLLSHAAYACLRPADPDSPDIVPPPPAPVGSGGPPVSTVDPSNPRCRVSCAAALFIEGLFQDELDKRGCGVIV
jgi:hypothetical protein